MTTLKLAWYLCNQLWTYFRRWFSVSVAVLNILGQPQTAIKKDDLETSKDMWRKSFSVKIYASNFQLLIYTTLQMFFQEFFKVLRHSFLELLLWLLLYRTDIGLTYVSIVFLKQEFYRARLFKMSAIKLLAEERIHLLLVRITCFIIFDLFDFIIYT